MSFLSRLNDSLRLIESKSRLRSKISNLMEDEIDDSDNGADDDAPWKDPNSSSYNRQKAEDALYHTIGPMRSDSKWVDKWTSPGPPVPGFAPGQPAPKWTQEQIIYAFAGDPNILWGNRDNPRSPQYGNKGGSPLYRTARKVAKIYNKAQDKSFIDDMYSNGFIALLRMMQPGFDAGRSPFISYVIRNVTSAMQHGVGGETRASAAAGMSHNLTIGNNKVAVRGLQSLLDETDPQVLRQSAQIVKGEYRTTQSHDKDDENPFGYFSAPYYQVLIKYADALEAQDPVAINDARNQMKELINRIDSYSTLIGGASTGLGQAIDTKDRTSSIGIVSADQPMGDDDGATIGSTLASSDEKEDIVDKEAISNVLEVAINQNLGQILANSEKYRAMAVELGAKDGKIGSAMPVNEFRYLIRTLGEYGSLYPGKGVMRENTNVPRDTKDWWKPGEDPEIEPIPGGTETWTSIWTRRGYEGMGPVAISQEMAQELEEFQQLGIPSGRKFTIKTDKKGNQVKQAVHKVAVQNALKSAMIKFKILVDIYKLGINEAVDSELANRILLLDKTDREMFVTCLEGIISKVENVVAKDGKPKPKRVIYNESKIIYMSPITNFL